jgi:hypothetical protein
MAQVDALPLSPSELHDCAEAYGADRFEAAMTDIVSETLERPHVW